MMTGYAGPIEAQTLQNVYFHQVLFTGEHTQLVVMCLEPGETIGAEMHPNVDQFFCIERGEGRFLVHDIEEQLVSDGDAVVIPAGTYHDVSTRRRRPHCSCTPSIRRPIIQPGR